MNTTVNYDKDEIISRLEARKVRLNFINIQPFLSLKTMIFGAESLVNKYNASYRGFVEEEFRNLVKEIYPSIIVIKTSEEKIKRMKEKLDRKEEPGKFSDNRMQKRENARVHTRRASLKSQYDAAVSEYNEEKAFLETALNIVVRLCLAAYFYTEKSLTFLKNIDCDDRNLVKVTYDTLYKHFIDKINNGGLSHDKEEN